MRLGLLTTTWRRPELTRAVAAHTATLRVPGVELVPIAVWSPEDMLPSADTPGWEYVRFPNWPVSDKWNAGSRRARDLGVDALTIMGSDDLLNAEYLSLVAGMIRGGADYVMPTSLYFVDAETKAAFYATGIGRVGGGRTFSRKLIDLCAGNLWEPGVSKNTDGANDRRLGFLGILKPDSTVDDMRAHGAALVGIKTKRNEHSFEKMRDGMNGEPVDARELLQTVAPAHAESIWELA